MRKRHASQYANFGSLLKDHIKKMSELPKKWSDIDNDLTRFNAIMKEKLDYQLPFFKLFNTYPSIKENYEKK